MKDMGKVMKAAQAALAAKTPTDGCQRGRKSESYGNRH
jgi:hypothetical protein